jgi:hypothetical protein
MSTKASKRHLRRLERQLRETSARKAWFLLWAVLALFLIVCLVFALQ